MKALLFVLAAASPTGENPTATQTFIAFKSLASCEQAKEALVAGIPRAGRLNTVTTMVGNHTMATTSAAPIPDTYFFPNEVKVFIRCTYAEGVMRD